MHIPLSHYDELFYTHPLLDEPVAEQDEEVFEELQYDVLYRSQHGLIPLRDAMFLAVTEGTLSEVAFLLELGADPNDGHPILEAIERDDFPVLQALLDAGARIEEDEDGIHPVNFAASSGSLDCLRVLAQHGIDLDATNSEDLTPLMSVDFMERHALDTFLLLLELGADIDAQNSRDETLLMRTARDYPLHIVERVLREGADRKLVNAKGRSVRDYAKKCLYSDTKEFFRY